MPMAADIVKTPFLVNEMVVYFISPQVAHVVEVDCRIELTTTPDSCTCCSFRFRSRLDPNYRCRHIEAVRQVLEKARHAGPGAEKVICGL